MTKYCVVIFCSCIVSLRKLNCAKLDEYGDGKYEHEQ